MRTNNKSRNLLFRANSILLMFVFLFLLMCCAPNKTEDINAITNREEYPSISYKELDAVVTDSGRLKHRLITPELLQFDQKEEPVTDFPQGLHFFSYNEDGSIESQIKCNTAKYFQKTELWELRNDVEVVNAKGEVVNTELLYWDTKKKRIYSDQFVKITSTDNVFTGNSFETNERIDPYVLKGVRGEMDVKEEQTNTESN